MGRGHARTAPGAPMSSPATIELAPNNKQGLSLRSPLMAGSGAVGYGDAWPPGVEPSIFGAVVTAPLSLHPQRGQAQPRLAEVPGGFLLATGDHNPGFRRVLRDHAPGWTRLPMPVIVALASSAPAEWPRLAQHLEEKSCAAGVELALPEGAGRSEAGAWVGAVRRACSLPLLVRLPSAGVMLLAPSCVDCGADALVVGTPPPALALAPPAETYASGWVEAPIAGPAALPFTLRSLRAVAGLGLATSLVAAGGIYSAADARRCLELGAAAVQVRGLLWTSPTGVAALLSDLLSPRGPNTPDPAG